VHWFGTALPSVGLALRVGLANMHELRARWMAIGAPDAGATPPVGPNLTEPLLGAGGTLAGIFASPLNGILLTTIIGSVVHTWWARTLAVVNFPQARIEGGDAEVQWLALDTLTLEERDGRTIARTHSVYQSVADRDAMVENGMAEGMNDGFDRLDDLRRDRRGLEGATEAERRCAALARPGPLLAEAQQEGVLAVGEEGSADRPARGALLVVAALAVAPCRGGGHDMGAAGGADALHQPGLGVGGMLEGDAGMGDVQPLEDLEDADVLLDQERLASVELDVLYVRQDLFHVLEEAFAVHRRCQRQLVALLADA